MFCQYKISQYSKIFSLILQKETVTHSSDGFIKAYIIGQKQESQSVHHPAYRQSASFQLQDLLQ